MAIVDNPGDCAGNLPEEAIQGFNLFNAGKYWLAHEALEEAWLNEENPVRNLYKGILQAVVTYLHIQRGNYQGAIKVFQRAMRWLDQYPDECRGIEVAQLRVDLQNAISKVKALGAERMEEFDPDLFKPILWK